MARTPKKVDAALKIDEGLHWESKFDTEALLRNLTVKLLCRVGYRDPQQKSAVEMLPADEQERGLELGQSPTLTMPC